MARVGWGRRSGGHLEEEEERDRGEGGPNGIGLVAAGWAQRPVTSGTRRRGLADSVLAWHATVAATCAKVANM